MGFNDFNNDLCSDAVEYYNSVAIRLIEAFQLVSGSASIIISVLFFFKCQQYFYFHKNSKILIILILGVTVLHGLSISSTQFFHLLRYFTAKNPCDVLISNRICFFLRFPAHLSMTLFVYIQAAVAIERTMAVLLSKNYEKISSFLGYFLALLVIALSLPPSYFFLSNWNLTEWTPYCSNMNFYTYTDMYTFICYYNTSIDIVSFLIFSFMRFYNLTILKKRAELDGSQRYQIQENENVFVILTPEILFHFLFSILYGVTNLFSFVVHDNCNSRQEFRTYLAAINTIPYYAVLSPLFMFLMLKRSRVQRRTAVINLTMKKQADQGSSYFVTLEAQWEAGALKRNFPVATT